MPPTVTNPSEAQAPTGEHSPGAHPGNATSQAQWLWLSVGCLLIGGLCAALWNTRRAGDATQDQQPERAQVLAGQLEEAGARLEAMRSEIEQLRGKLTQYEKAAAEGQNLAKQMSEELQRARAAAGLTPVKGPGIVVQLDDAPARAGHPEDQSVYMIHDVDLLQIVNELRAAEAEAIAINGQRLTATSEVRCSGPVAKVNNTPIVPPFDIRAIGDSKALQGALELPGGVLSILRPFEIQVKITLKSEVELPAAEVSQSFRHLRAVEPTPKPESVPENAETP